MRHVKHCTVCGRAFEASPSSKKITCSSACSAVQKSQSHRGVPRIITDEWRRNMKKEGAALEKARKSALAASRAAQTLPESQKGPQNRTCKVYTLKSPENVMHTAIGLLPWARENYLLFEPNSQDREASARRISNGFRAIISQSPSRRSRPVGTYKGWQVVYSGEKTEEDQAAAMERYHKAERTDTHEKGYQR